MYIYYFRINYTIILIDMMELGYNKFHFFQFSFLLYLHEIAQRFISENYSNI